MHAVFIPSAKFEYLVKIYIFDITFYEIQHSRLRKKKTKRDRLKEAVTCMI